MEWFRHIDPFWVTFGPLLVINIYIFCSLAFFFATLKNRKVPEEVQRKTQYNSRFLSRHLKHWWFWLNGPFARLCIRLKITPNMLTIFGFCSSVLAALFFAQGLFGVGGWVSAFGGTFDWIDGHVARLSGQTSKSGAFFDSVMDRFSEGVIFIGFAYYFRNSWVLFFVIAGLIGSMVVSYTRARGETVGVDVRTGSMQRPERMMYLSMSSILQPMATVGISFFMNNPPPYLVIAAVCLIGVMTNGTAVHRMIFVMNQLKGVTKS